MKQATNLFEPSLFSNALGVTEEERAASPRADARPSTPTNLKSLAAPKALVELLGTTFLLMAVVGSGIMAERLSGGNEAIALLANTLATSAALYALISGFGPISGAHFNPAVTLSALFQKKLSPSLSVSFLGAQLLGAFLGVALAHLMFELPVYSLSQHARGGSSLMLSEFIATFGLLAVILFTSKNKPENTPLAVAAYIAGAYWFTASTSFANPAVTLARAFTDTFSGIALVNVLGFVVAQLLGAFAAVAAFSWISRQDIRGDHQT
jgi:glycerol uptake facilitator-like aquaporin